MRLSLSHPPESRRLLVAGSVCWIISGLDLGEPLHAGGMDFGYAVFERSALNLIFDLAIPQSAFKGDELPLLERFGELREIPPGKDAMPFGPGFVVAFVVLPALLGCDVEDDVLAVVLSGFGFCVLTRRPMRMTLLNMVSGSVSSDLSAVCGTCLPGGCAVATHSLGDWTESAEGDPDSLWGRSPHLAEARSGFWKGDRASEGRGALSAAR